MGRCKLHGGSGANGPTSPTMQEYSAAQAASALSRLGFEAIQPTDPQEELLRQVALARARVDSLAYQHRLAYEEYSNAEDGSKAKARAWLQKEALAEKYDTERYRAAKISKGALDAGVARRQVELAERQGAQIYLVVQNVLVQLGLPQDRLDNAKDLIAGEFRRLAEV